MLEEAKALLIEMIRNKCVNPPGGEMRNINTVRKYLDSYGIESEVLESAPERGNLLAVIEGTGEKPSLMFGPSHVDVVPVQNPDTWTVPPFEGLEKDGCIWGRGALDMLFFVASQTVAFAHLHKEGFRPKGTLKLLIVADEEAGGTQGANWLVENYPEKVKVDYLITEQGGEPVANNRMAYWYAEKGMAWLRLRFKGEEQHGSTPYGSNNAVVKMAEAVHRLAKYQPPRDTQYIQPMLEGIGVSSLIRALAGNTKTLPKLLSTLANSNPGLAKLVHALTQMTISPNIVKGGTKVNVIPGEAILDVDIRLLPGQDEQYAHTQLKKALGSLSEETSIERIPVEEGGSVYPGTSSRKDSPLVEVLLGVTKDLMGPDYELVPLMSPGGTDAKVFRHTFGTQAYGFAVHDATLSMQTIQSLFHGDDERISIGTIDMTIKAYLGIAQSFLG